MWVPQLLGARLTPASWSHFQSCNESLRILHPLHTPESRQLFLELSKYKSLDPRAPGKCGAEQTEGRKMGAGQCPCTGLAAMSSPSINLKLSDPHPLLAGLSIPVSPEFSAHVPFSQTWLFFFFFFWPGKCHGQWSLVGHSP